jgi:IPT/TIG domain
MRRIVIICLTLVAAALLVLPAAAVAATKKKAPSPQITRVQPMRISVGGRLTITGKHFKATRTKNTIIFRSGDGRTAFVKPRSASSRKLVLVVPASVARLLKVSNSRQQPTRLKLRVLAGSFSKFTPKRLSPVVTSAGSGDGPGGGGGPGGTPTVCNNSSDHDGDLLSNSLELNIGTDPCLADTDRDGMTDGWEYWSAKDLNVKAVPYPGSRPFPNALDPSDGGPAGAQFSSYDFDGDGLTTLEEYRAWRITGSGFDTSHVAVGLESALGYSDGTKYSRASSAPSVPAWQSSAYGLANPTQPFPATYEMHGTPGVWTDDERDADADGLSNFLESVRGPGHYSWWKGFMKQESVQIEQWKTKSYCGDPGPPPVPSQRPGDFDQRPFADVDLANPDVDGDTLLDGEDDQDNDDYSNITEMYEAVYDLDGNGALGDNPPWCGKPAGLIPSIDRGGIDWAVNAFNPCAPDPASRTCPPYIPFE